MTDPSPDQLRAFAGALRTLSVLFTRVAGEQSAAHGSFGKQELRALDVLGVRGPSRMGVLAGHLGVGQSAVTPLVDRLVEAGAVRRQQSEADRRVWLVELTAAGEEVFRAESAVYERVAAAMLGPLSEADRAALLYLLARVSETVEGGTGGQ